MGWTLYFMKKNVLFIGKVLLKIVTIKTEVIVADSSAARWHLLLIYRSRPWNIANLLLDRLAIAPTSLQSEMTLMVNDYGWKCTWLNGEESFYKTPTFTSAPPCARRCKSYLFPIAPSLGMSLPRNPVRTWDLSCVLLQLQPGHPSHDPSYLYVAAKFMWGHRALGEPWSAFLYAETASSNRSVIMKAMPNHW